MASAMLNVGLADDHAERVGEQVPADDPPLVDLAIRAAEYVPKRAGTGSGSSIFSGQEADAPRWFRRLQDG
jgi:hypothetical protein